MRSTIVLSQAIHFLIWNSMVEKAWIFKKISPCSSIHVNIQEESILVMTNKWESTVPLHTCNPWKPKCERWFAQACLNFTGLFHQVVFIILLNHASSNLHHIYPTRNVEHAKQDHNQATYASGQSSDNKNCSPKVQLQWSRD